MRMFLSPRFFVKSEAHTHTHIHNMFHSILFRTSPLFNLRWCSHRKKTRRRTYITLQSMHGLLKEKEREREREEMRLKTPFFLVANSSHSTTTRVDLTHLKLKCS
jgi:hypothetical protein